MQPSPSLSLVVEVQAARELDANNHEIFKLMSCGWTRMELFDQYNQVLKLTYCVRYTAEKIRGH